MKRFAPSRRWISYQHSIRLFFLYIFRWAVFILSTSSYILTKDTLEFNVSLQYATFNMATPCALVIDKDIVLNCQIKRVTFGGVVSTNYPCYKISYRLIFEISHTCFQCAVKCIYWHTCELCYNWLFKHI